MADTCPTCGQHVPDRSPLDLPWRRMQWIERRAVVAMMLDHLAGPRGRGPRAGWRMLELAPMAQLRYRQAVNAMRRLLRAGWVERPERGVYRLTSEGAGRLAAVVAPGGRLSNYDPPRPPRARPHK